MSEPAPGPDASPYQVWCDAEYIDTVWLRPRQFGVDPRDIAGRLVRDLPYPQATVGATPAARGLTGLESWFWVTGYTGAPIRDMVTEFGLQVDVEATPVSVSWDFGDGFTARGLGLGAAPPAPATVTHTFERRARPTFTVRSLIQLAVRWRLNGGAWQTLHPVARTATLAYPVLESRAALVPDRSVANPVVTAAGRPDGTRRSSRMVQVPTGNLGGCFLLLAPTRSLVSNPRSSTS